MNNVPLATSDAFDLTKMCRNIESVGKIENSGSDSFANLSCLEADFSEVLKKCTKIDTLIDEVVALKLVIEAKDSSPSSEPATETKDESNSEADDEADDEADLESDSESDSVRISDASDNDNRHMTPVVPNSQPVTNNNKTENDRMTEGGY